MPEASYYQDGDTLDYTPAAALSSGQVIQVPDGRAAMAVGDIAAGVQGAVQVSGVFQKVAKTAGFVALRGGKAYWDYSANKVYYKKVNDQDFYIGRFMSDAASADTECYVVANIDPPADIDINRDPCNTVLVGTPAALAVSFNYARRIGGSHLAYLSATSEAQKWDLMSVNGFSKNANAIVEFAFRVPVGGSGSASDYSIGVANATHATDADSITQHLFVHLDGGSTNINLQSKDGTTTVTATDTTIDFVAGTAITSQHEVWMDMRDPADVQVYIDGSLVLPSTVFNIDAATTLYLLAHMEKTTGTETADLIIDWMRARFMDQ